MSKNELVKLPREVAEALDDFKNAHPYPIRSVFDVVYKEDNENTRSLMGSVIKEFCESDRSRRIELLAKAIVNGYEVEQTPEDIIAQLYRLPPFTNSIGAYRIGIVDTLNALNIKIKGVNV